jgi:hypothetical protein
MTEAEWLESSDPRAMLSFLQEGGKVSNRKLRLVAVACCRLNWGLLPSEAARKVVELAERFVDGMATAEGLDASWASAGTLGDAALVLHCIPARFGGLGPEDLAQSEGETLIGLLAGELSAAANTSAEAAAIAARDAAGGSPAGMRAVRARDAARDAAYQEHEGQCCGLLRCVFHPFRPLPPPGEAVLCWNEGLVGKMATAIYDERDFSLQRMGVLADALEEAGVTDAELLGHLRGSGPHCRGCFALDAVLGKS